MHAVLPTYGFGFGRLFIVHQSWMKTVFSSIPNDLEILFSSTSSYNTNLKPSGVAKLRHAAKLLSWIRRSVPWKTRTVQSHAAWHLRRRWFSNTQWAQERYKDVERILWQLIKIHKRYVKSKDHKICKIHRRIFLCCYFHQ